MSTEAVAWVLERGANETIFFIWGTVGATATSEKGVVNPASWCVAKWPDGASCRATVVNSVDSLELEGYHLATGPVPLDITLAEAKEAVLGKGYGARRLAGRLKLLVLFKDAPG